jgi:hypothetical protein
MEFKNVLNSVKMKGGDAYIKQPSDLGRLMVRSATTTFYSEIPMRCEGIRCSVVRFLLMRLQTRPALWYQMN